jgi:hypothetical protein
MRDTPTPTEPLTSLTLPALARVAGLSVAFAASGTAIVAAAVIALVPVWIAALAHAAMTAAGVWCARRESDPRPARALWLLAVSYGGLGPLGAAGTLLSVTLGLHFDRRATPVDEWRRVLFPEQEEDKDADLWALVGLRRTDRPSTIAPFVDVLEHGTLAQKQAVVALIARHFRPAFAPALRRALQDPQNAVRVQAATAVSLIEAEATTGALDLERQRAERPEDVALLLSLARHEDSYAFTGLLDPGREQESRARAVDAYRAYLAARPEDVTACHELGRLLARLGRHDEALVCFEQALHREDAVATRIWLMECLFHLRRFEALRELARESAGLMAGNPSVLPIETRQVLRLWVPEAATVP